MEKVSIIIATYNGIDFLRNCLPTVLQTDYPDFEIIICDDASDDGSGPYLQQFSKENNKVKVLTNIENCGAAKSRNIAAQHASGDILVFLDNDTQVDTQWITELIKTMNSDQNCAAAQSTLVHYARRDTIQLIGTHLIPATFWGVPLKAEEKIKQNNTELQKIVALSAAMAVRTDVFTKIKGFDEKLAVYTEDLEFSIRIWISGYTILNAPQSTVYHILKKVNDRKNMKATTKKIYFHLAKNSIRSILKNYSLLFIIFYLPQTFTILTIRALLKLIQKDYNALTGTLQGVLWNISNITDTLQQRKFVQKELRRYTDKQVADYVFTRLTLLSIYNNYFKK